MAQSTRVRISFAIVGAFTLVASCSPHAGTATYKYLRAVGVVRHIVDTDDQMRIPSLVRGEDYHKLRTVSARMDQYKQSMARLEKEGVDIEAIEFTKSFEALLDSFNIVCADTAKLLEEEEHVRGMSSQSAAGDPAIRKVLANAKGNTIAVLGSLPQTLDLLDNQQGADSQLLRPYFDTVRAERDVLIQARKAILKKAAKLKEDLTQKYPDYDWSVAEILPK
jgi:hypothetical protein